MPTIEANYWQTRSNARLLCDSRATCLHQCEVGLRVVRSIMPTQH